MATTKEGGAFFAASPPEKSPPPHAAAAPSPSATCVPACAITARQTREMGSSTASPSRRVQELLRQLQSSDASRSTPVGRCNNTAYIDRELTRQSRRSFFECHSLKAPNPEILRSLPRTWASRCPSAAMANVICRGNRYPTSQSRQRSYRRPIYCWLGGT